MKHILPLSDQMDLNFFSKPYFQIIRKKRVAILCIAVSVILFSGCSGGSKKTESQQQTDVSVNQAEETDSLRSETEINDQDSVVRKTEVFQSSNKSGFIGVSDDKPLDNPVDNVFHVSIDQSVKNGDKVWLEYELWGISDCSGISKSINSSLSKGGYFAQRKEAWTSQKELINPSNLKSGDNVIRFGIASDADYGYQIRDVKLRVVPQDELSSADPRQLVVNIPDNRYYYGTTGYLQGFVTGKDAQKAQIFIGDEKVWSDKGNFESLVEKSMTEAEQWSVLVKAVFPDGEEILSEAVFKKPGEWSVQNGFDRNIHRTEKCVSPDAGFLVQLGHVKLSGESGSVNEETNVSVTALRDIDVPALDAGMVNVTAGHKGYRFLPDGTEFNDFVSLEMGYDTTLIPNGYSEDDIRTFYFDDKTHHWISIPKDTLLLASNSLVSRTHHFTDYINGIIKVPESPETQGYTPTSLKDVKAANPATGINQIQPPSANSRGNANLSYPINIPAGRQGMQPQLAISYNSGGGNGWLGLGWNLSVPSITVETRWGVPHFNDIYESETYLMGGDQLSPVAHRDEWEKRNKNSETEKQFFPRVEGSFSKIIRHGTHPAEYWWEVTDKAGTKYYYGANSGGKIIEDAILRKEYRNDTTAIAQWGLVEVRDLFDNNVRYYYDIQVDAGLGDGRVDEGKGIKLEGAQIYLSKITYTGHKREDGEYSVEFVRDREEDGTQENRRKDVTINARYGFKQVTADRLKEIIINYGKEKIRSYELKYDYGAFEKSLLKTIVEKDGKDSIFTKHQFEYYDDVISGNDYEPYEGAFERWNTQNDKIKGDFVSGYLGVLDDNASAISGTKTKSKGAGLSANVGIGVEVWSKNSTVGGNYSYSKSESDGQLSLMDINGDGLPDKLYVEGDSLKFKPQIRISNDSIVYPKEARTIIFDEDGGPNSFLKSESKSHSVGIEALFGVSIGANYGFGKSITSTYLTEANGDGLVDIVTNGVVLFNYVDEKGNVHFTRNSTKTPNSIRSGVLASGLVKVDSAELKKARKDNPLHDVVKMWKAPMEGEIEVKAPLHLVKDSSSVRANYPADGVSVAIQHNERELWRRSIGPEDYALKNPGTLSFSVKKGDNIYFRVQSRDDGAYDQVRWTPEIFYSDQDTSLIDANGNKVFKYKANKDYVLTAPNGFMATPIDGVVNVESHLFIPPTSDSIRVEILRNNEIIREFDVDWRTGFNDSININGQRVYKDDIFNFRLISSTNIEWEDVRWRPHVYYTASYDDEVESVTDRYGDPIINSYVIPEFSLYPHVNFFTEQWVARDSSELLISPGLKFKKGRRQWSDLTGDKNLTFTVKKRDSLIYKKVIELTYNSYMDSVIFEMPDSIIAIAKENESIFLEYHATNFGLANLISDSKSQIICKEYTRDTISCENPDSLNVEKIEKVIAGQDTLCVYKDIIERTDSVSAGVISVSPEDYQIFGNMYRNWGQFAYDGNGERAAQVIHEEELNIDEAKNSAEKMEKNEMSFDNVEDDKDLGDSFEEQGAYNPEGDKFIMLIPYGGKNSFIGQDELTYVTSNIISSSRRGQDRLELFDPLASQGNGATAIDKISKNESVSFNAGASSKVGSIGGSYSRAWDKLITDYMDMNGDRYPDIVTDKKIQFTNHLGALSTGGDYELPYLTEANNYSTSNSFGISAGGTQLGSEKEPSKDPESAKYALTGNESLSGNFANNQTHYTWLDINGDGLPDRVNKDNDGNSIGVRLNMGYELAPEETWGNFDIQKGESISIQAGGGGSVGGAIGKKISKEINIDNGSIKAGIGLGGSRNILKRGLQDINGDGLLDLVEVDETILEAIIEDGTGLPTVNKPVQVRINTGNGFSSPVKWKGANFTNKSKTANESLNVAFTAGFSIFGTVKVTVTPQANLQRSYSKQNLTLKDIDGDGFPDYIESDSDKEIRVKKSRLGKINKLKKVDIPLKSEFTLDYKPVGNTYEMPQSVWTLSKVEVYDGFEGDGVDTLKTSFEYSKGYHDRYERAFYGFGQVKTNQLDEKGEVYRSTLRTFANDNYYNKGLLLSETLLDSQGNKYVETVNKYELLDREMEALAAAPENVEVAFPALKETHKYFYEGEDTPQKQTWMSFEYGDYGNVEGYTDYGDPDDDTDNLTSTIRYWDLSDRHILSVPKSVAVEGGKENFRERSTQVDDYTGKITQISQSYEDGVAVYDLFYDDYGNLDSIVHPKNYKDERMYFAYDYDDQVHSYVTAVRDAYGYSSSTTYDYRFGQVKSTTDINGQQTTYKIDNLGRITHITGPYELASGEDYTIHFEYHPDAEIPWAHTFHFDPEHPENKIETSIFIDGLGRVLQTKKDAALFKKKNAPDTEVMVASGKVEYDALGRSVASWYPVIDDEREPSALIEEVDSVDPTTVEYDVMDRAILTVLPDNAQTKTEYGFGKDRDDELQFMTTVEDANGKVTSSYKDIRGRQTAVKAPGEVWTSFVYNPIGELLEATDDEGNTTFSTYDDLGRRLSRNHPDAGLTEYTYDAAGNMLTQVTANLRETNQEIVYTYYYNRPTGIEYPQNSINNVKYEYGEPGADFNRAGRVVLQEDATGAQEFFYGPLGEVVKNIRTIIVPEEGVFTFETKWEYDTWNRLKHMTYPDGEELTYNYNTGGLLLSMHGQKKGHLYDYLSQIGYDKFEDRKYISYGNGTETTYEYESDRRRLHHIEALTSAGRKMMDNTYIYDNVNNITGLKSEAPIPSADLKGGRFEYNYEYDDLYRLTDATGHYEGATHEHKYTLSMDYSTTGRILHKGQEHIRRGYDDVDWAPRHKTTYDWEYRYEGEKPHAPSQIGENTYTYDANGNTTGWQSTKNKQRRDILWDEENRMRAIADNGVAHHYMYDASGQRVIKATGDGQAVYVNGFPMAGSGTVGNYTMYVNPFMVVSNMKFTKHFYIEGQRIVSKIGEMGEYQDMLNPKDTLKAGGDKVNWDKKKDNQKAQLIANFEALGLDGALFTAGKSGKVPYGRIKKYFRENDGLVNGGDSPANMDTISTGGNKPEKLQFYYHPDHLGSSSYITDISGEVYQHMEYFPFGETVIEERTDAAYTSYLYNGKELDEETGLYYYGARYYDARISMFYGVDNFAEKYAFQSPFGYASNNPIRNIDINGDSTFVADLGKGKYKVVGGSLKGNDKGIYVVGQNEDGTYQSNGEKLGESLFIDSFYSYDSDGHGPDFYGTIDINSTEGADWLSNFSKDAPTLAGYVFNKESYDYKSNGIGNRQGDDAINYKYRGGKYGSEFASARDIGNMAAGYAAGNGGLDYGTTRFIFDSFQATGNKNILGGMWRTMRGAGAVDAPNSQHGQEYGWKMGYRQYRSRVGQYWNRKWSGSW